MNPYITGHREKRLLGALFYYCETIVYFIFSNGYESLYIQQDIYLRMSIFDLSMTHISIILIYDWYRIVVCMHTHV